MAAGLTPLAQDVHAGIRFHSKFGHSAPRADLGPRQRPGTHNIRLPFSDRTISAKLSGDSSFRKNPKMLPPLRSSSRPTSAPYTDFLPSTASRNLQPQHWPSLLCRRLTGRNGWAISAVPSGLVPQVWPNPTLKRWAILISPSGMSPGRPEATSQFLPRLYCRDPPATRCISTARSAKSRRCFLRFATCHGQRLHLTRVFCYPARCAPPAPTQAGFFVPKGLPDNSPALQRRDGVWTFFRGKPPGCPLNAQYQRRESPESNEKCPNSRAPGH